jgi:hypothetical protein
VSNILNGIADAKTLELFDVIRCSDRTNTPFLISSTKMTRKQYYNRILLLRDKGLVSRDKGIYSLTSFGRVVAYALEVIEKAYEENWKFKVIDKASLEDAERLRTLLITDPEMNDILCKCKQ